MEVTRHDETRNHLDGGHCLALIAFGDLEGWVEKGMKKAAVLLALISLLTVSASASYIHESYIPEDVVSENRDGRQLIIKTYTLSPADDPEGLVEEAFELEGYVYHHLETVKDEQAFEDTKAHTETVTVETNSNDLSAILEQLAPTMEYSKDGYYGTLTLDHTTIRTEAAGYTTKYYTISDTKQFTGLDRNDPSYIPATSVKNGSTLKLSGITWTVTGTSLADDTLVPTSYTATATYTATGSQSVATGYVTTANYSGEVTSEGIQAIRYTVTYLGSPIGLFSGIGSWWFIAAIAGILLLSILVASVYFLHFRPNATIYAMNARGVVYKKLGKQRISPRSPRLDLTRLREYPSGDASVELPSKLAHKLASRIITIQMFGGSRTHLVEPYEGQESYWFAIKEDEKEEDS